VELCTLSSTIAILMFMAHLGSLLYVTFVIFLTFFPNLGKGTLYRESNIILTFY
jgi:hypothetical protein